MTRLSTFAVSLAFGLFGALPSLAQVSPSAPETTARVATPPPIEGCEDYVESCRRGSGHAASIRGSGAYIDQIGTSNQATITQTFGSTRAYAKIAQDGHGNSATIEQNASSAFAAIAQAGDANIASIEQSGTEHNTAVIAQLGDRNTASVSQEGGHVAAINQLGDDNKISLNQDGNSNTAILSQFGDENKMNVNQSGSNNALTWIQAGNNLGGVGVSMDGNRSLTIIQSR